jgi:hypothetical protein
MGLVMICGLVDRIAQVTKTASTHIDDALEEV